MRIKNDTALSFKKDATTDCCVSQVGDSVPK